MHVQGSNACSLNLKNLQDAILDCRVKNLERNIGRLGRRKLRQKSGLEAMAGELGGKRDLRENHCHHGEDLIA